MIEVTTTRRSFMPMRSFVDRAGERWVVWSVLPQQSGARVPSPLRAGWLCFAPENGEARYRLPMSEAPLGWEALADQRLDLLCRVAAVLASPVIPTASGAPTELES